MPFNLSSNIVYKFLCGRRSATYYGKTCRHMNVRVGTHSGVSPLTGKKLKSETAAAVKNHVLVCDHVVFLEYFKNLAIGNSEFHLGIKEIIFISRDKPELNRNEKSLLSLFINVFPHKYFICTRF